MRPGRTEPPSPASGVARPTERLEEVVAFYRDGLGSPMLGGFSDYDGYDGLMIGLPGWEHHLEFSHHCHGSPCLAPTRDNLLVLYFLNPADIDQLAARRAERGHKPAERENPYWCGRSITVEDPDGWRVVPCRML